MILEQLYGITPEREKEITKLVKKCKIDYPDFEDFIYNMGKCGYFDWKEQYYIIAKETLNLEDKNE